MSDKTASASTAKTDDQRAADYASGKRGLERASGAAGSDQVQAATDAAEAQGYFGVSPDPTPRHHYTVAGQIAGKPTPETDPGAQAAADQAARDLSEKGAGAGEVPPAGDGPKA